MYANYHTHTPLCHHAIGTPEEYIEKAIENRLHILGFSDHVPQIFGNDYVSRIRMAPEETAGYVETLSALREKYRGRIEIRIGYEAEYYPKHWEKTLAHIRENQCDYLILGQHFTNNEYDGLYVANVNCDKTLLIQYVDQSIEALQTGVFSAFAHPDLVFYDPYDRLYEQEMTRLCEAAKAFGVPLEYNLLGILAKRHYPVKRFWEIAAAVGTDTVIGCDAHDPRFLGEPELYQAGLSFLRSLGITPLRELSLKKP